MSVRAATNAIVSKTAVKEYLNLDDADDQVDDFLQRWINSVSSGIENYIGGPVKVQTFTEIYDGSGSSLLVLRKRPIVSLATPAVGDVQYRENLTAEWQTLIANVSCVVIRSNEPWYVELYESVFPCGVQNIQIGYRAGYSNIPGDIERVVVESVAEIHKESNKGSGRLGQGSKGVSASGVNDSTSFFRLAKEHKAILSRYRWRLP